MTKHKNIKVVELFAGVGGFRLGLEKSSQVFKTIWSNQWEPNKVKQHAFDCYVKNFGNNKSHINENISLVKSSVPKHDLLVGGFPCQDYSVARTGAQGIEGKKGVLWWDINDILKEKKPNYVLLENVDRLIKSPSNQKGRDFAIILRCLSDLGYSVEWRVINAAEYGKSQRRRRIFIFAFKKNTPLYKNLKENFDIQKESFLKTWILTSGFYAPMFPVKNEIKNKKETLVSIDYDSFETLTDISSNFKSILYNSGIMIDNKICSLETIPVDINPIPLKDIISKKTVEERFFLKDNLDKWKLLKGSKRINRIRPNGEPYIFSEGALSFPDSLEKPARTILTSESSVNRSSHVVEDLLTKKLRLLTPEECELLNGFPPGWTDTGMPEKFRYFTMGNALVVDVVTMIGNRILEIIK